MGLRCLMGHDFGDVLTQRDRRERGDEVVVTVREYRECARCGETRTVSENTEVRTAGRGGSADAEPAGSAQSGEAPAGDREFDDVSADDDDGVILEDEPEGRQPGAWPEADDAEPGTTASTDEPEPWPDVEGEDEGFAAEPSDRTPVEGVQFGSGLTPESTGDVGEADEGGEVVESAPPAGGRRSGSTGSGGRRQQAVTADTELVCPECEHTAPVENASLRPGDICPECRMGYLTERSR